MKVCYLIPFLILLLFSCKPERKINWKQELKGFGQFSLNDSTSITFYCKGNEWTFNNTWHHFRLSGDTVFFSAESFYNFIDRQFRDSLNWKQNIPYQLKKDTSGITLNKISGPNYFPKHLSYYRPSGEPDPDFRIYKEDYHDGSENIYLVIDSNYNVSLSNESPVETDHPRFYCVQTNTQTRKDCISFVNLLIKNRRKSKEFMGIICSPKGYYVDLVFNDSVYRYDQYLAHPLKMPLSLILKTKNSKFKKCLGPGDVSDYCHKFPVAVASIYRNPNYIPQTINFLSPVVSK